MYTLFFFKFRLQEKNTTYSFFVKKQEIIRTLENVLDSQELDTEHVIDIIYQEQSLFKVCPVTRCSR